MSVCTHGSEPKATRIKPCQRCGHSAPAIVPTLLGGEFYLICRGCDAETPIAKTKEAAIELWNSGTFEERAPD